MKRMFPLFAILALAAVVFLGGKALAGPGNGPGPGSGGGFGAFYSQLSPEKRQAVDKIFEGHEQTLFDLRQQLWARNTELSALMDSGKAEETSVRALTTQIVDLRTRQNVELKALHDEISKETGISLTFRGMGGASCCDDGQGGPGGKGMGKGPGAGRGPGDCPLAGTPNCPVLGGQSQ